jgi:hypothetical protein
MKFKQFIRKPVDWALMPANWAKKQNFKEWFKIKPVVFPAVNYNGMEITFAGIPHIYMPPRQTRKALAKLGGLTLTESTRYRKKYFEKRLNDPNAVPLEEWVYKQLFKNKGKTGDFKPGLFKTVYTDEIRRSVGPKNEMGRAVMVPAFVVSSLGNFWPPLRLAREKSWNTTEAITDAKRRIIELIKIRNTGGTEQYLGYKTDLNSVKRLLKSSKWEYLHTFRSLLMRDALDAFSRMGIERLNIVTGKYHSPQIKIFLENDGIRQKFEENLPDALKRIREGYNRRLDIMVENYGNRKFVPKDPALKFQEIAELHLSA